MRGRIINYRNQEISHKIKNAIPNIPIQIRINFRNSLVRQK